MSLKYGLLGFLDSKGAMTGYDLNKLFKAIFGYIWPVQRSQIYHELKLMEKKGWVTSNIIFQREKPNKKEYLITSEGENQLKKWLKESSIDDPLRIKNTFLMKLFFSKKVDINETIKLLKEFKAECMNLIVFSKLSSKVIDYYGEVQFAENETYLNAISRFEESYANLCIKWADETIEDLKQKQKQRESNK
jgi:DNA-binding PadR family transcriptional regulator